MRFSLRRKTAIIIILLAVILSGTAIIVSSRIIAAMIDEQYSTMANGLADTIAVTVDTEAVKQCVDDVRTVFDTADNRVGSEKWGTAEFDEYVSLFSDVSDKEYYKSLLEQLRSIQDVNDVDCIYIVYMDVPTESFVYVVDADMEEPCPPGCFDPLYDMNREILSDPSVGFPAYITNTDEYGWLVTAGAPVYYNGEVIAYSMVDISMDEIRSKQNSFICTLVVILLIVTVIISAVVMAVVEHRVVKPINMLSDAATRYCAEKDISQASFEFAGIDIRTGDEIENLSESMKQMERDINDNISNLLATTEELTNTRIHADIMNELALKDALTGIRNKTAYDMEIEKLTEELNEGNAKFGMAMIDLNFLKTINDTYGHEKGNIAIQRLCHIICSTFVHSPVFRIGGDEFVVILQNNDYENVKELVESFNAIIDDLAADTSIEPWERASAAMGYALYDPRRDVSVEDVFKRADGAMYLRKKEMKSNITNHKA